MYEINQYQDKYEIYELKDISTNSWVKVAPERGGIIISYGVQGEEKLYLDKNTFYDYDANIRGGIPILFPICGVLKDGKYSLNGKEYSMRNHGIARINKWKVIEQNTENGASIKIMLESNEEIKNSYPFDFKVIFTYTLKDGCLSIGQEYLNESEERMPIYAGFHPYFKAQDKNIKYFTDSTKYLDENDSKVKCYNGKLNLQGMVESAIFLENKQGNISFKPDDSKGLFLEYSKEFKYIVLWSIDGREFVCVEPWMALGDSLNTGKDIYYIEPHSTLDLYLNIKTF